MKDTIMVTVVLSDNSHTPMLCLNLKRRGDSATQVRAPSHGGSPRCGRSLAAILLGVSLGIPAAWCGAATNSLPDDADKAVAAFRAALANPGLQYIVGTPTNLNELLAKQAALETEMADLAREFIIRFPGSPYVPHARLEEIKILANKRRTMDLNGAYEDAFLDESMPEFVRYRLRLQQMQVRNPSRMTSTNYAKDLIQLRREFPKVGRVYEDLLQFASQSPSGSARDVARELVNSNIGWGGIKRAAERIADDRDLATLRQLAEQGQAEAMCDLAIRYADGRGVGKDLAEAAKWMRRAAEQGNPRGQRNMGVFYSNGMGMQRNLTQGARWYRLAAEQGDPLAEFNLANVYLDGQGVPKSEVEGVAWLRKSAEQGFCDAQLALGQCYREGRGVRRDGAEAISWFQKAAAQGWMTAQFRLGAMYEKGDGVSPNPAEAVKWYRLAANQGNYAAQNALAAMLLEGRGTPRNECEAVLWYRMGSDFDDGVSDLHMGICYENGLVVVTNIVLAQSMYYNAATRGVPEAYWRLANLYASDKGAKGAAERALRYYRQAADSGEIEGQNGLAWMLATADDPKLRNGSEAVELAQEVVKSTHRKEARFLSTLAAAYAETGDFGKAVSAQKEVITLITNKSEIATAESRLKAYQSHVPFRQTH